MTYQDALNHIREHITLLNANMNVYDNKICNVIDALENFAIPSLEKDIPKKVALYECRAEYGRRYYGCPNCREYIKYEYSCDKYDYEPVCCEWCGQELDWE